MSQSPSKMSDEQLIMFALNVLLSGMPASNDINALRAKLVERSSKQKKNKRKGASHEPTG